MYSHLKAHIAQLADKTVLVVGDVILDEYIVGRAARMSREAPVPVLELESRRYIAGGAANPAANIAALGSQAIQVGVIGADEPGKRLIRVLQSQGIDSAGIITCRDRPTTIKTRILAQMGLRFPQQVTRIDTLSRQAIDPATEAKIIDFVTAQISGANAVLLSHYHGGLLTPSLVRQIRELCRQFQILLTADVQGHFDKFVGLDVIKCNADDAQSHLGWALETDADSTAPPDSCINSLTSKGQPSSPAAAMEPPWPQTMRPITARRPRSAMSLILSALATPLSPSSPWRWPPKSSHRMP